MYNAIEVRDEVRPLVIVSEATEISYRAHFALALLRAYAADWGAFSVRLTRNLRDDTFSVALTGDAQANLLGDRTREGGRLYKYTQITLTTNMAATTLIRAALTCAAKLRTTFITPL